MVFCVAPLVSTGAAFVCSYSHVFGSQTICSDEQIFRVNRLDWITLWNNPFISQSVQLSSPSTESHPAGIRSPSPGPSLRGERCMSNDSITDHDTVESEPRVIDSRWVTQARLSPSPALRHVLEVQSRKYHTLSFDNCREAYSTCWSKLAAFSLLKVFAFRNSCWLSPELNLSTSSSVQVSETTQPDRMWRTSPASDRELGITLLSVYTVQMDSEMTWKHSVVTMCAVLQPRQSRCVSDDSGVNDVQCCRFVQSEVVLAIYQSVSTASYCHYIT